MTARRLAQEIFAALGERQALLAPTPAKAIARAALARWDTGYRKVEARLWREVLRIGEAERLFVVVTTKAGAERLRLWGWTADPELSAQVDASGEALGDDLIDLGRLPLSALKAALKDAGAGVVRQSRLESALRLGVERGCWQVADRGGSLVPADSTGAAPKRPAVAHSGPTICSRCGAADMHKFGVHSVLGSSNSWTLCRDCYCAKAASLKGLPRPTHRFVFRVLKPWKCKWCGVERTPTAPAEARTLAAPTGYNCPKADAWWNHRPR